MRFQRQISFWVAMLCLCAKVFAQEHCEREYRFQGISLYGDTCWVESISHGTCEQALFIQLWLGQTQAKPVEMSAAEHLRWIERTHQPHYLSYRVMLEQKGGKFVYPLAGLSIKDPSYNAALYNIYHEELRFACGEAWNNAMGYEKGIDLPKIDSSKSPILLYAAPEGLYFNYEITKAYYLPDVRLLILFTHNSNKCAHGAHADGFLIFRMQ